MRNRDLKKLSSSLVYYAATGESEQSCVDTCISVGISRFVHNNRLMKINTSLCRIGRIKHDIEIEEKP